MIGFSYYKGHPVPKGTKPCLLCQLATRGTTTLVHLGYGEHVWLCEAHGSAEFRRSPSGRDLGLSLSFASASAGAWTARRQRAVDRFVATDAYADAAASARPRPGSYAWPDLRRAVEEVCRRGRVSMAQLVALCQSALRGALKTGWGRMPSVRTLRRWRAERRWELPGWSAPAKLPRGA